ncbi:hypothetical protein [Alloactinosynnema sp. L-07]|nr:hypothetical protein [Alloactinosynnema sp. L-07]
MVGEKTHLRLQSKTIRAHHDRPHRRVRQASPELPPPRMQHR